MSAGSNRSHRADQILNAHAWRSAAWAALAFALLSVGFCAGAGVAQAQVPGFTAAEVQTLGDLNFIARAKLNHTGPIKDRLYALAMALKQINGANVSSWKAQDPDPGSILGFMADTDPDGHDPYNRSLIDRLANYLQVPVKAVVWPVTASQPPPAPAPAPAPVPAPESTPGAVEAAIQAAIDSKIAGLQAQVTGLATRLAAVEARPNAGGPVAVPTVEGGTLYVPNRIIIGRCAHPDASSMLQICGQGDANIHVESNLDSTQYQNRRPHVGMWSLSGDGGLRIIQNAYATTQCFQDTDPTNGVKYTNCLKKFVDPSREVSMTGVDSRGRFSLLMQEPGRAYDYTQNLVVNYYYDQRVIRFESMQSGWVFRFATSDSPRSLNVEYPVPRQ